MDIGKIIAINVKRLREEKNWSQAQLADKAGLSKVIVSQMEKGDSNPTVNTIWKLTGAFNLPYTSLLELPQDKAIHIKKEDIVELVEEKYHIFSYYPKNQDRNFEVYQIEVEAGCIHPSIGHSSKSYEYIMMVEGEMTIMVGDHRYELKVDDGLYFDATSSPHTYINQGNEIAKAVLLIQYI